MPYAIFSFQPFLSQKNWRKFGGKSERGLMNLFLWTGMKHYHLTIFRHPWIYPFQKVWRLAWAIFCILAVSGNREPPLFHWLSKLQLLLQSHLFVMISNIFPQYQRLLGKLTKPNLKFRNCFYGVCLWFSGLAAF